MVELDELLKNTSEELKCSLIYLTGYSNKELKPFIKRFNDKLNAYSKEQNFEEAQKIKNYLFLLQNFLEFNSFREKISSFDKQTFKILENLNIEISNTKVNLKIELSDEDIEFLKIHPDNDTLANFYSELLLILRFIRNKEAYTIGG